MLTLASASSRSLSEATCALHKHRTYDRPTLYYSFYCHPFERALYMGLITLLGLASVIIVLTPKYSTPKYRPVRAGLFVALGLSGVAPIVHGTMITKGWHFLVEMLGIKYVMISGAVYIFGAMLYVAHIPERLSPGTFDLVGASHQLFHICVLIAAWLHWLSLRHNYVFWHALQITAGTTSVPAMCSLMNRLNH